MLNSQYLKTELSNDANFLHVDLSPWKQQIDWIISSSLTPWNLRFGPKTLQIRLVDDFS